MSLQFSDDNKDNDTDELSARCKTFIQRMEKKLEFKKSVQNPHYQDDRYLIR